MPPGPGCSSRRSSRRPGRPSCTSRSPSSSRRWRPARSAEACPGLPVRATSRPGTAGPAGRRTSDPGTGPSPERPGRRCCRRCTSGSRRPRGRPPRSDASWTRSAIVIGRLATRLPAFAASSVAGHASRWRSRRRRRNARRGSAGRRAGSRRPRRSRTRPARAGRAAGGDASVRIPALSRPWPAGSNGSAASHSSTGGASTSDREAAPRGFRRRRPTSPPPAIPPVARITAPVRNGRSRAAAATTTAVTRLPSRSMRCDLFTDPDPPTPFPQRGSQRVEEADAGHARRDERDLERGERQDRPGVGERRRVVVEPEDRRERDPGCARRRAARRRAAIVSSAALRHPASSNSLARSKPAEVAPAGNAGQLDRQRFDRGPRSRQTPGRAEARRDRRRPEVLEPRGPADDEALAVGPRSEGRGLARPARSKRAGCRRSRSASSPAGRRATPA